MTTFDNWVLVSATIAGSLLGWGLLRKWWPADQRREHNDITGWQVSVLGTTYAVIVGFMLFAAWADFRTADQNSDIEASCVINLYWAASGLPEGQRDEIRSLAYDYAKTIVTREWPAMARGEVTHDASQIVQRMWSTAAAAQPLTSSQEVGLAQVMTEISSIAKHRRIRQLQNETTLPAILWIVLIVGAVITLLSACMFGSQKPFLHMLQVTTLALMISLSLAAIADINRPFRGQVHVLPTGFENALRVFHRYGPAPGER